MKTINDLVDKLNNGVAYGEYCIAKGKHENYLLCSSYEAGEYVTIFEFAKKQPYWSIYSSLGAKNNKVQKEIMDFVYTTDKEHWFDEPEKKYNIIIGEDAGKNWQSAYKKCHFGAKVNDAVREEDLTLDDYQFTESEIEDLKATLPDNMAKIIDIAKVEVKDENN
ncbi:hypothetical protein AKUA2103_PHAGE100180 (plasmid) [Apilactobacillus kunkeei]|nr:hypothetical protein AKUA2103_PHAGE100180 [Apilactobacillus kunkeei]CAI2699262.1 hypothetical protein AKUA1003_PHAGE100180 [Apilactobacillus kunkeei]